MKKNSRKKHKSKVQNPPLFHVALTYEDVYDDIENFNPYQEIKDIPTIAILNFVIRLQDRVFYRFGEESLQRMLIHEMTEYFEKEQRKKILAFIQRKEALLLNSETTLILYGIIFSSFCDFEEDDNEFELTFEECQKVYKVLLYCNSLWVKEQDVDNSDKRNSIDLSLQVDLPISEFKFPKDFKSQLFKAYHFFEFCSRTPHFKEYLNAFCEDRQTYNWKEYLFGLLNSFTSSLKSPSISIPQEYGSIKRFLDTFTIGKNDLSAKKYSDYHEKILYLRDHFLVNQSPNDYLLLNRNLLVDKFYQGVKFDIYNSIATHKLTRPNGRPFGSMKDFNALCGESFSESQLLYPLLQKTYDNGKNILVSGEEMKKQGITAEPDYYIREGKFVYLFEFKDITLGDNIKFSKDIPFIKKEILKRLCWEKHENGKTIRKGGAQLLKTIERMLNENLMAKWDDVKSNAECIFPIIVTTDSAFSAFGVNASVKEQFFYLMASYDINYPIFTSCPIIVDYDTLINIGYQLSIGKISLGKLLCDYIRFAVPLCSFKVYIMDLHLSDHTDIEGETRFLFGELANALEN